jgi:hypothetical protein
MDGRTVAGEQGSRTSVAWRSFSGAFLVLVLSTPLSASQSEGPALEREQGWSFLLAPYLWIVGFDGELTIDGQEIDGDGDSGGFPREFSLTGGFLGHFEARKGPWALALSPVLVDVESDGDDTPPVDTDIALSGTIVEGFAAYAFGGGWDVLGGVRYYAVDADVDVSLGGVPQPDLEADKSWIDPILGVRYASLLGERWSFQARADVGGFGVGSDFAWNAATELGFRLASCARLFVGYRALDFDFADGSGSERVEYDVRLWGPLVGVSFDL